MPLGKGPLPPAQAYGDDVAIAASPLGVTDRRPSLFRRPVQDGGCVSPINPLRALTGWEPAFPYLETPGFPGP